MRTSHSKPKLRLVMADESAPGGSGALERFSHSPLSCRPRAAILHDVSPFPTPVDSGPVARENAHAADIAADDPRWVLAQSVAANLEHGRAAVLPPEKRARLISHAHRLGLRSFDASLVIALVQSHARTNGAGLDASVASGLRLVGEPTAAPSSQRQRDPDGPTWRMFLASVVLSMGITAGLVAWLLA